MPIMARLAEWVGYKNSKLENLIKTAIFHPKGLQYIVPIKLKIVTKDNAVGSLSHAN